MIIRNSPFPAQINASNKNNETKQVAKNEALESTQEVKNEKLDEIKQQLDNGTYKIDIGKTADKMAQDLLIEMRIFR